MPVLKKQVVQDFRVQVEVAMKSLDSFSLRERPKAPNMEAMPTPDASRKLGESLRPEGGFSPLFLL